MSTLAAPAAHAPHTLGRPISSAIARTLGAARQDDADALALHAMEISLFLGSGVTLLQLLAGPALYRAHGVEGGALSAALTSALGVDGMALYFASQGARRPNWPLVGAVLRMLVAVGGGWAALRITGQLVPAFLALVAGLLIMGLVNAVAVAHGAWFRP